MDPAGVIPFMLGLMGITLVPAFLAPMARDGKLARNASIGIKTRHTLASDEAWLAGHRRAAPLMAAATWAGWAMLAGATILCVLGQFGFAFATTGAGYLAVITLLMISAAKANRAARGV